MGKLSLCVLPWTRLVVRVSGRFSGVFCLGKQLESPGGRRDYKPGAHPWGPVRAHRGWTAVIGGNSRGFSLSLLREFHPFMAVIPGTAFAAAKGIGAAVLARRGHALDICLCLPEKGFEKSSSLNNHEKVRAADRTINRELTRAHAKSFLSSHEDATNLVLRPVADVAHGLVS